MSEIVNREGSGNPPVVVESNQVENEPVRIRRRVLIMQSIDPCCMPLSHAVIFISIMEMIIYTIGFGYYISLALEDDANVRNFYGHNSFYEERQKANALDEDTTKLIKSVSIAQAAVCFIYVFMCGLLIYGAVKRIANIAFAWIIAVVCLSLARLILLIVAPLPVFQFGLLWILFEIYFTFVVVTFYYEVKRNPEGVDYDYVSEYPVEIPIVEPVYSVSYAYPPVGYQLVPVNQRTIFVQNANARTQVPRNQIENENQTRTVTN